MVKNEHLLIFFGVFVSVAFIYAWYAVSLPFNQVGGAFHGGSEPSFLSPFTAVLLVIWLLLLVAVVYITKHHKE